MIPILMWLLIEEDRKRREEDERTGYVPELPPDWFAWSLLVISLGFLGVVLYTIDWRVFFG